MQMFEHILASCDGVLVINLDSRPDKWTQFQEAWRDILPWEKVHRLSAISGVNLPGYNEKPWFTTHTTNRARVWAGVAGCSLSQRKAIEYAKKSGWKRLIIFEDDIEPSSYCSASTEIDISCLPVAGLLYLGVSKMPRYGTCIQGDPKQHGIWRIPGVLSTYAYVVFNEAYDCLLNNLPTEENIWSWVARNRAVDTWLREAFENTSGLRTYSVFPQMVQQSGGMSDITGEILAAGFNLLDGLDAKPPQYTRFLYAIRNFFSQFAMRFKVFFNGHRRYKRATRNGFPGYKNKT